jgi:hypothetical protein
MKFIFRVFMTLGIAQKLLMPEGRLIAMMIYPVRRFIPFFALMAIQIL